MAVHDFNDCPQEERHIYVTYEHEGNKFPLVVHQHCSKCARVIGKYRLKNAVFDSVEIKFGKDGSSILEPYSIDHIKADCTYCGEVALEASFAE